MICNRKSVSKIVGDLLSYLQKTINDNIDFAARDELVLKISILSEKYSPSHSWYVDTMLKLIAIAGDNMIDHIWYRAIKIITNHEDVQEYATLTVFNALKEPSCNTTMVKVGSYILGEYGNLISEKPGCDQKSIFQVVHQHFIATDDDRSKAVILSTYMKFINLFDDLAPIIVNIFDHYRSCIDSEIQQRACEYLALATCNDRSMIENVCDVMPAYEETKDELEFAVEIKEEEEEYKQPEPIVFEEVPLPADLMVARPQSVQPSQPSQPTQTNVNSSPQNGMSQEERDRERAKKKALKKEQREIEKQKGQLENYHKEALSDLTSQFQDRQQQLHDQELQLQKAEQDLLAKEKLAQKKMARLEQKEKEREAAKTQRRDLQVEAKKQEITAHFQTQKTQAEQQLQQQALTAQQQQLMALAEQQKAAEQELINVARQVVAQQEQEIMEKKKQSETLLRAQFQEAMVAHEQALNLQGQRAQALVDKEKQLVAMQNQLQKQFEEKQAQINQEATRQLELAKQKATQDQEQKAAELRMAAQQQAAILQQKEAALNAQQQQLAAKEQRVREAEEKERNVAAREAQLAQQQALLMKQAQDAANALALEKQKMAEEQNRAMLQAAALLKQEREKLAVQQLQQQQKQQQIAVFTEQERQRIAAIAQQEQQKVLQKQKELEIAKQQAAQQMQVQQQVLQQQALAEQQRLAQIAQVAEQERKKAEFEKQQALQQQAQAMQQQQQAQALALAQQQAQAMATQAEQMRLQQANQQANQALAQQQQQAALAQMQLQQQAQQAQLQAQAMIAHAEMLRKASIMDKGNVYEDTSLQIGMNSQFGNGKGKMEIYFMNKSQTVFNNFEVKMPPVPYLTFQLNPPPSSLSPNQQGTLQLQFSCDAPFDTYPELHIGFFVNGVVQQSKIKLPIGLTRFCEPLVLPGQEWFTRWSQINGAPQEITEQFIAVTCNPQHITALFKDGFKWAILPNVDTNPNNLVGAGTFHSSRGSVHCYMRLETFPQQNGIRLTIKSGSSEVNQSLKNIFLAQLSQQQKQAQPQPIPQPQMTTTINVTPKPTVQPTFSQQSTNRTQVFANPSTGPNIFATNVSPQPTPTMHTTGRQVVPQQTNTNIFATNVTKPQQPQLINVFATNTPMIPNQNTVQPSPFATNVNVNTNRNNAFPQNVFATNVNTNNQNPSPFGRPQGQPSPFGQPQPQQPQTAQQILNSHQPGGY